MMNIKAILSDHKEWLDSKDRSCKCADFQGDNLLGTILEGRIRESVDNFKQKAFLS